METFTFVMIDMDTIEIEATNLNGAIHLLKVMGFDYIEIIQH